MTDAYRDWRKRVILSCAGPVAGELQRFETVEEAIGAGRYLKRQHPQFRYFVEDQGRFVWDSDNDTPPLPALTKGDKT